MPAERRRTAFISDVHGNIDALKAVLRDIRRQEVGSIACLGDVIGYGAAPGECVSLMMELCPATVLGNHEAMGFFDVVYLEEMPARVKKPLEIAQEQLSPAQISWLRDLPLVAKAGSSAIVHSSFHHASSFPYLDRPELARKHLDAQPTRISFHGHSHVPVVWELRGKTAAAYRPQISTIRLSKEGRYSVNPGSVGQPRDGDPRASYVIYDEETEDLIFRRVAYDIEAACQKILEAKIPARNAERLIKGE